MTLSINRLMRPFIPDEYANPRFQVEIESHIDYLRDHPSTEIVALDPANVYYNEGDIVGYLNSTKIDPNLHWLIMRVNHLYKNEQFKELDRLIVPSIETINALRKAIASTYL